MKVHRELRDACVVIKRGLAELHYASMKIEGFSPVRSIDSEEVLGEATSSVPIILESYLPSGGGPSNGDPSDLRSLDEGTV